MDTISAISFGNDYSGHVVARWDHCEAGTVNLLTVGFSGQSGYFEFIDEKDQLWGLKITWPNTIDNRDILAFGYRMARMVGRSAKVGMVSYRFEEQLEFFLPACRYQIFKVTPDFVWENQYE